MALLEVNHLKTHFKTENGIARAVDGVSFTIDEGQSLALVGESGCGKSVTAMSLMRLIRGPKGYHPEGQVKLMGIDLLKANPEVLESMRGHKMAMIFQEPMTALNPVYTIGQQLREPLIKHLKLTPEQADQKSHYLLQKMGIKHSDVVLKNYPHQLSGGMRQRVMIAMAMSCDPKLLIADEPTTALDVTIQAQILSLIRDLQKETGMALLLITHDLGVVNQMSDKIHVMYSGLIVEKGDRTQILSRPKHPYTQKLLECIPRSTSRGKKLPVIPGMVRLATDFPMHCRFAERCGFAKPICTQSSPDLDAQDVACFAYQAQHQNDFKSFFNPASHASIDSKSTTETLIPQLGAPSSPTAPLIAIDQIKTHFPIKRGFFNQTVGHIMAVDGISLDIPQGVSLAIVGESGCGKSTFGQSVLRLLNEAQGSVKFEGVDVLKIPYAQTRPLRKSLQIIFQDPFASLNPRMSVREIIGEGLRVHEHHLTDEQKQTKIDEVLVECGLNPAVSKRYPHEFSGGQRQRIAIARALVLRPKFIVLDEATSALDVSVQAQILNLLADLQKKYGLTYFFITHDIGVVSYIADVVAVMYLGRIVEYGPAQSVLTNPKHPYTQGLLASVPKMDIDSKLVAPLMGDVPMPINPPKGCHFHTRCPEYAKNKDALHLCAKNYPEAQGDLKTWVRCHLPL